MPLFRYSGSIRTGNRVSLDLLNKGGVAVDLSVKSLGKFNCEISPKNVVSTDEELKVTITTADLSRLDNPQIQISFNDRIGKSHSLLFKYDYQKNSLIEISAS